MREIKEFEIKKIVLETLLDAIRGIKNWGPDEWQADFEISVQEYLEEIRSDLSILKKGSK